MKIFLESILFEPDYFIDNACIGLDELDDLGGNVRVDVVGYWEAEVSAAVHLYCYVNGLKKRCFVYAGEDEIAFVEGFGSLSGGAYADGGNWLANAEKETTFFR